MDKTFKRKIDYSPRLKRYTQKHTQTHKLGVRTKEGRNFFYELFCVEKPDFAFNFFKPILSGKFSFMQNIFSVRAQGVHHCGAYEMPGLWLASRTLRPQNSMAQQRLSSRSPTQHLPYTLQDFKSTPWIAPWPCRLISVSFYKMLIWQKLVFKKQKKANTTRIGPKERHRMKLQT